MRAARIFLRMPLLISHFYRDIDIDEDDGASIEAGYHITLPRFL